MRRMRVRYAIEYRGSFELPVDFVYDSFFIINENYDTFSQTARNLIKDRVFDMKEYLIGLFKDLMTKQIRKYLGRPDRLKPNSESKIKEIYQAQDLDQYPDVFNIYTLRSSSHVDEKGERIPNLRWGMIAKKVVEIRDSNNTKELLNLLAYQGGLFNLVHNTKTSVLDKFINGRELLSALNDCANNPNPSTYLPKTSQQIKDAFEMKKQDQDAGVSAPLPEVDYTKKQTGPSWDKPSYKHNPNYYGD
jgi:hypothetical protein